MQKKLEAIINTLPTHLNQSQTSKLKNKLEKLWVDIGTIGETEESIFVPKGFENVRQLKKYDIILYKVGPCRHYHIVFKVVQNIAYALTITSDKTEAWQGNSIELTGSRFLFGHVCLLPVAINMQSSQYTFVGLFDNKKAFDNVVKQAKANLVKLLNLNRHETKRRKARKLCKHPFRDIA